MAKRILIGEDRAASRELLRTVLEQQGYEVIEACDGEQAIAKAQAELPDLVLLDLNMPRRNGYEVLNALRDDRRLDATPIVAVTASAMMGDRQKILAAGFNGYLTKPVSLAVLREEINRLFPSS